jgi:hypothetical protein
MIFESLHLDDPNTWSKAAKNGRLRFGFWKRCAALQCLGRGLQNEWLYFYTFLSISCCCCALSVKYKKTCTVGVETLEELMGSFFYCTLHNDFAAHGLVLGKLCKKLVSCMPKQKGFSQIFQKIKYRLLTFWFSVVQIQLIRCVCMCLQLGAAKHREHEHSDECMCSSWPMATGLTFAAAVRWASENLPATDPLACVKPINLSSLNGKMPMNRGYQGVPILDACIFEWLSWFPVTMFWHVATTLSSRHALTYNIYIYLFIYLNIPDDSLWLCLCFLLSGP